MTMPTRPANDYLNIVGVPQHPQHQGGALPSERGGPDMTMPTSDSEYVREAQAQREQDLALAKIAADERVRLAEIRQQQRDARRPIIYIIISVVAVLLLAGILAAAVTWNTNSARINRQRAQDQQAEVAKQCILAGDIWANGNCLITRKAG